MRSPTAVIAEDEPLLRSEIRELLNTLWPQLAICSEAANGLQAIEAIDRYSPDVVFLDIHMPGANGLEIAEHCSGRAHVVFITAFDQHAVSAFEHGALDYVMKPLTAARMERTVARLHERLQQPPADLQGLAQLLKKASAGESQYIKWLTVPHLGERRVIAASEIWYLRADAKYTTLATRASTFLLNSSLKQMKEKLNPEMFWQIHRSIIVNVGAIETIHRSFRGALELKLKERTELLPVSAAHAHLFRQF
jgi:DNA-binding LytR/AlgR family response regulator